MEGNIKKSLPDSPGSDFFVSHKNQVLNNFQKLFFESHFYSKIESGEDGKKEYDK
ncbi:hypothetical protein HMPREF0556_10625 [Listeria grayi DSM 20601]|uniref:Uncharacterized protein n=1 Tax=Listeria grayi DSM 20601 TaxID=525367 RepID=D7UWL4_LISGR|nr:hypothetical protein HMPREF0556_10625 [Listeria grayi DSM 20601]